MRKIVIVVLTLTLVICARAYAQTDLLSFWNDGPAKKAIVEFVQVLPKEPRLLLNDDKAGKPEGIHLMIGRRPYAAFGNSIGDKQMLEYTQAGEGARLMMLVYHDDAVREYAYGPKSKVGTFTDALMAQAKKNGWTVISMKNDWKRIFAWEQ